MDTDNSLDSAFEVTAALVEKHLLGYLMIDNAPWWDVAPDLNPSDFGGYVNCRIYLAIEELMSSGLPVNVIALFERLGGDELYQEAGGVRLLAQMSKNTCVCRDQVTALTHLVHGFGLLRACLGRKHQGQAVCSLLAAKAHGWPHGDSWVVTIDDLVREKQDIPVELLGQRVCYVFGERAVGSLSE
ncbi:hypothetical protein HNP46_006559 [Pseudomonas nitritireducens]|uniref:DNA helicase DnaB-like N-terminal domain-containing protein n=1 Tax=Pseudomonas nitroreducens TaxID=46680 RepID=A0A7W7KRI0_PSENT|nr:DnaB-like helicase N-terminal domain-containing protein [Pseudomonas nitritireducens]MBB4867640.1 hypothetical protein [Pseudomonas nitritireducens]